MEGTSTDVAIAPGNLDQARAWDGHEGEVWTEHAERYNRTGRHIWRAFLEGHPIATTSDVVDVGCGTGHSTREIARLAAEGRVLGVDLSAVMLELARRSARDAGLNNVRFEQGDAQVYPFEPGAFDLAFSSFGAMFFADQSAAFANIGRALRPGGRIALLAWRELQRNEWLMLLRRELAFGRDLPQPPSTGSSPFGLSDPAHVRAVLGDADFEDVQLTPIDEPVDLGSDADDAFAFVKTMGIVEGLTSGIDAASVSPALERVRAALERYQTDDGVLVPASAWLITGRRR